MIREAELINGKIMCRDTPEGDWYEYPNELLTEYMFFMQKENEEMEECVSRLEHEVSILKQIIEENIK